MKYFILNYIKGALGESGECCKNNYDFENACEVCGTGAKLIGKLRTKGLSKIKKDFFETLDGDIIISKRLYEELVKEKIRLNDIKNIVDFKNRDLPFFHLSSLLTLPPVTEKEGLVTEGQCSSCKRNGYFNKAIIGNKERNIPTQVFTIGLHYSKINANFLELGDFFHTWECIGLSNRIAYGNYVIRYARPLLIVNERLKTALQKLKISGLDFEQIEFNLLE